MRIFIILLLLAGCCTADAQLRRNIDSIKKELQLTNGQVMEIIEIDTAYLKDMEGIRDRADTGYNPPKHIQYQHKYTLLRRFRAYKELLTPEQYVKIRALRFDIYRYSNWLADFYKKNNLPPIGEALAKLEKARQ
jgi:hypothetical protein